MHQPRLSRLARIHLKHPFYFLTLCAFQRKHLLAQSVVHDAFVVFCESGPAYGAFIGRSVLMPDHLHLFVTFGAEGIVLSDWVKSLKNTLSKCWRSAGVASPHWPKGVFDHVMRSADSCEEEWNYVAANPLRAGSAPSLETGPYQGMIHEVHF